MIERFSQRPVADVELAIELLIAERLTQQQQLPSGPSIVTEQAVEQIHDVLFPSKSLIERSQYLLCIAKVRKHGYSASITKPLGFRRIPRDADEAPTKLFGSPAIPNSIANIGVLREPRQIELR
jgi:hypothetical protein